MPNNQSKMAKGPDPAKPAPRRVLVRNSTDVLADECVANSQLDPTQTNKSAMKELLVANGKMKTRANARLATLGEYSPEFVENYLQEPYEKTLARALARVPPLARNVLLRVKVDKIYKSVMEFNADQAQHVNYPMQLQIVVHIHDRFRSMSDEQNGLKALATANHLMRFFQLVLKPALEAAAATALIVGAVKPKNADKIRTLAKFNEWCQGKGKSYCFLDTTHLVQMRENCMLVDSALSLGKCQKLKDKVDQVVAAREEKTQQYIFWAGLQHLVDKAAIDELLKEVMMMMYTFLFNGTHAELTDTKLKTALNAADCPELLIWQAIARRIYNSQWVEVKISLRDLFRQNFRGCLSQLITLLDGFGEPVHPSFQVLRTVLFNIAELNQKECMKLPAAVTDTLAGVFKNKILELDEEKAAADYKRVEQAFMDGAELFEQSMADSLDMEVWEEIFVTINNARWEPRSKPAAFYNFFKLMDEILRSPDADHEGNAKKLKGFIDAMTTLFPSHQEVGDAFHEFTIQFRTMDLKGAKEKISHAITQGNWADANRYYEEVDTTFDFLHADPRDDLYKLIKRKWPAGNPANNGAQPVAAVGFGSVNMVL